MFVNPLAYMGPISDNPPPADSFDKRRWSAQQRKAAHLSGRVGGAGSSQSSRAPAVVTAPSTAAGGRGDATTELGDGGEGVEGIAGPGPGLESEVVDVQGRFATQMAEVRGSCLVFFGGEGGGGGCSTGVSD